MPLEHTLSPDQTLIDVANVERYAGEFWMPPLEQLAGGDPAIVEQARASVDAGPAGPTCTQKQDGRPAPTGSVSPNDLRGCGPKYGLLTSRETWIQAGIEGRIGQAQTGSKCKSTEPGCSPCTEGASAKCVDVMGYHDAREIPPTTGHTRRTSCCRTACTSPIRRGVGPSTSFRSPPGRPRA